MQINLLEEPPLIFRYGQEMLDPRDGLTTFGPVDADSPSHPSRLVVGLIGPEGADENFPVWSTQLVSPAHTNHAVFDTRNWPHYPGFEAAFDCAFPASPAWFGQISRDSVITSSRLRDPYERVARVVDAYIAKLEAASKRDEHFDLLLCVVPDEVHQNCRPESQVTGGHGPSLTKSERKTRAASAGLFNSYNPDEYRRSRDFRRQLKARAMQYGIPLQLINESKFGIWSGDEEKGTDTPVSAKAWFLSTGLFYKAGGRPWKLATARKGVCYIGLAFKCSDDPLADSRTACCAAQMFLEVLRHNLWVAN